MLLREKNDYFARGELDVCDTYVNIRTKLKVKDKYGYCLLRPDRLLLNSSGSLQSALDKTKYFIQMTKEVHGDMYGYDKVNYIHSCQDVIITCPQHGDFHQTPRRHLNGN